MAVTVGVGGSAGPVCATSLGGTGSISKFGSFLAANGGVGGNTGWIGGAANSTGSYISIAGDGGAAGPYNNSSSTGGKGETD